MVLSGPKAGAAYDAFHELAERDFKGNLTQCFMSVIIEAKEKKEKKKNAK